MHASLSVKGRPCDCQAVHAPRLVVLTGGPGAGKTAVLEIARRHFCRHVLVLPESAGILFGGGFPRLTTDDGLRAAQRAIFHVQHELEQLALADRSAALILCDRGTLDGLAYWPGSSLSFLQAVGTSRDAELGRYSVVIHLRTPAALDGYGRGNPLRIESAEQAHVIDERIGLAWHGHPRRVEVPSSQDFMSKTRLAIAAIEAEVPSCCR